MSSVANLIDRVEKIIQLNESAIQPNRGSSNNRVQFSCVSPSVINEESSSDSSMRSNHSLVVEPAATLPSQPHVIGHLNQRQPRHESTVNVTRSQSAVNNDHLMGARIGYDMNVPNSLNGFGSGTTSVFVSNTSNSLYNATTHSSPATNVYHSVPTSPHINLQPSFMHSSNNHHSENLHHARRDSRNYHSTYAFPSATPNSAFGIGSSSGLNIKASQIASRQVLNKDLPIFSGNPEDWPIFITNYVQSTERCGFSKQENLIRLQHSLRGRALEAVKGHMTNPSIVPLIIETLQMLFGCPEMILRDLQKKLKNEPIIRTDNLNEIVKFSLTLRNYIATVESLNLHPYLSDPTLLSELTDNLPNNLRLEWGRYKLSSPIVNLVMFDQWLFEHARCASAVVSSIDSYSASSNAKAKTFKRTNLMVHQEKTIETKNKCVRFSKDHMLSDCDEFKNLLRNDRWEFVKSNGLCQNYFNKHHIRFRKLQRRCGVDGCRLRHHSLLHSIPGHSRPINTSTSSKNRSNSMDMAQVNVHNNRRTSTIFRMIPIKIYGPSKVLMKLAWKDQLMNCA